MKKIFLCTLVAGVFVAGNTAIAGVDVGVGVNVRAGLPAPPPLPVPVVVAAPPPVPVVVVPKGDNGRHLGHYKHKGKHKKHH